MMERNSVVRSSGETRSVGQSTGPSIGLSRKLILRSGTIFVAEARFNRDNTFQGMRLVHEGRGAIYCPAAMINDLVAALAGRSTGKKRLAHSDYWQLWVSPINGAGGERTAVVVQVVGRSSRNEAWRPRDRITITSDQAPEVVSLIRDFVRELRAYLNFEE
jgi:hypothetical protein